MKNRLTAFLLALAVAVSTFGGLGAVTAQPVLADDPAFPANLATGLSLTDKTYDVYFGQKEGDAATGAVKVLTEGKLTVNNRAFPKTLAEFQEKGFTINGKAITLDSRVNETTYAYYALRALTEAVPAGNILNLYDTNGDKICDEIGYIVFIAFIYGKMISDRGGITIERADIPGSDAYSGYEFAAGNKTYLKKENLDINLESGDMAVAWLNRSDDWVVLRANQYTGTLGSVADDGTVELRVDGGLLSVKPSTGFDDSNVLISNRVSSFADALLYFDLDFQSENPAEVSLWAVPVGDAAGAPAGFTASNAVSREMLRKALAVAGTRLSQVVTDIADAAAKHAKYWTTEEVYKQVSGAIEEAEAVFINSEASEELLNYEFYKLYIALKDLDSASFPAASQVVLSGNRLIYVDVYGNQDTSYTGFAEGEGAVWYVMQGEAATGYNGLIYGEVDGKNAWWYVTGGKLRTDYTGLANNQWGWWYVENGAVNFHFTGLVFNAWGYWYVNNGLVDFGFTGFAPNEWGWWRVEKGMVNFKANGLYTYAGYTWLTKGGYIDTSYNGLYSEDGDRFFFITKGYVDTSYTGFATGVHGDWLVIRGEIDFDYTGYVTVGGERWYVEGGKRIRQA